MIIEDLIIINSMENDYGTTNRFKSNTTFKTSKYLLLRKM